MGRIAILIIALLVASCSPDAEVKGSANKCATDLYRSYNPMAEFECFHS